MKNNNPIKEIFGQDFVFGMVLAPVTKCHYRLRNIMRMFYDNCACMLLY